MYLFCNVYKRKFDVQMLRRRERIGYCVNIYLLKEFAATPQNGQRSSCKPISKSAVSWRRITIKLFQKDIKRDILLIMCSFIQKIYTFSKIYSRLVSTRTYTSLLCKAIDRSGLRQCCESQISIFQTVTFVLISSTDTFQHIFSIDATHF